MLKTSALQTRYIYYMAYVCSRYNALSDWLARSDSGAFFSRNAYGPIMGLQKQSKKSYKQLINLERSVFAEKS